jgi:hypothetical protein
MSQKKIKCGATNKAPTENPPIQVGEAVESVAALAKLASASMPPRMAYDVMLLLAELRQCPEVIACSKAKDAAMQRHGKDVGGGHYEFTPEQMASFSAEYAPIAAATLKVAAKRLPLTVLDHAPQMSPNDIFALRPFLE